MIYSIICNNNKSKECNMYTKALLITASMFISTSQALESFTDIELSNIIGQSSNLENISNDNGIYSFDLLKNEPLLFPIMNIFNYEQHVGNITYHDSNNIVSFMNDHSTKVNLPKNIEFIELKKIRPKNSNDDNSFGNLTFFNIQFSKGSYFIIRNL